MGTADFESEGILPSGADTSLLVTTHWRPYWEGEGEGEGGGCLVSGPYIELAYVGLVVHYLFVSHIYVRNP